LNILCFLKLITFPFNGVICYLVMYLFQKDSPSGEGMHLSASSPKILSLAFLLFPQFQQRLAAVV